MLVYKVSRIRHLRYTFLLAYEEHFAPTKIVSCKKGFPMKQRILTLMLLTITLIPVVGIAKEAANRPNILLIAVDDMGYSDIAPFGGEINTPNINSLAKKGLKFTNFYTGPSCSATRSMLLSGHDNHVAGLGNMYERLTPNQTGKPGLEGQTDQNRRWLLRSLCA